jgi:hypothetical protein
VAQNAFRHGLNLSVLSDDDLVPEIETLAQRIAYGSTDPLFRGLARQIAAAQAELNRVRSKKLRVIAAANFEATGESRDEVREESKPTRKLRSALVAAVIERSGAEIGSDVPPRRERLSLTLDEVCLELELLDRYERRAFFATEIRYQKFRSFGELRQSSLDH